MKFSERLMEMLKSDNAIMCKDSLSNVNRTAVLHGPYAGVWVYTCNNKRVKYQDPGMLSKAKVYTMEATKMVFNAPTGLFEIKANIEMKSSRNARLAVWKAKKIGYSSSVNYIDHLIKTVKLPEKFNRLRSSWEEGVRHMFWYKPECVMQEIDNMNKFDFFVKLSTMRPCLASLGVKKRWSVINYAWKLGWNKGLKTAFSTCHPRIINELYAKLNEASQNNTRMALYSNIFSKGGKILTAARENLSLDQVMEWSAYLNEVERNDRDKKDLLDKKNFFKYVVPPTNIFPSGPHQRLTSYAFELANIRFLMNRPDTRAFDWGNILIWNISDKISPAEAQARHDYIVMRRQDYYRDQNNMTEIQLVAFHERNWKTKFGMDEVKPFVIGELEIRPLITRVAFTVEGEEMHHCIGMYFNQAEYMFCGVTYRGKRGSLMWNSKTNKIVQLYGVCNEILPQEFHHAVMNVFN